jgi:hemerythrin-like domain-containing protein
MAHAEQDRITPLKNEHKSISRQLNVVGGEMTGSPPSDRLQRSIDRLGLLVEKHFAGEEESLYGPLKLRLGRKNSVDAMTEEHKAIRRTLKELHSSLARCQADSDRVGELRSCFDSLQRELGEHIEREETVVFWLADLKL